MKSAAFAFAVLSALSACTDPAPASHHTAVPRPDPDTLTSIAISFAGDLMCHRPQWTWCQVHDTTFDFTPCFELIRPALEKSDLMTGNLETVTAGKSRPLHGFPVFNAPDEYVRDMARVGFDVLSTSNNHTIDQGYQGVYRTIEVITKNGMSYYGSSLNPADRDSVRIYDVKGIRIAQIGYTENTNGLELPVGKPWVVNLIDTALIHKDMNAARRAGAEIVVVYFHFGEEYTRVPNDYQRLIVEITKSFGADIIIGGHTHTIQPVDYFPASPAATLDTGFVIYSMGNFFSNQTDRYSDVGLILNLELTKNNKSGKIKLTDVSYIPTWIYRGFHPSKKLHVIFPAEMSKRDSLPAYIDAGSRAKMLQAFNDTRAHIVKYSSCIRLMGMEEFSGKE